MFPVQGPSVPRTGPFSGQSSNYSLHDTSASLGGLLSNAGLRRTGCLSVNDQSSRPYLGVVCGEPWKGGGGGDGGVKAGVTAPHLSHLDIPEVVAALEQFKVPVHISLYVI